MRTRPSAWMLRRYYAIGLGGNTDYTAYSSVYEVCILTFRTTVARGHVSSDYRVLIHSCHVRGNRVTVGFSWIAHAATNHFFVSLAVSGGSVPLHHPTRKPRHTARSMLKNFWLLVVIQWPVLLIKLISVLPVCRARSSRLGPLDSPSPALRTTKPPIRQRSWECRG